MSGKSPTNRTQISLIGSIAGASGALATGKGGVAAQQRRALQTPAATRLG